MSNLNKGPAIPDFKPNKQESQLGRLNGKRERNRVRTKTHKAKQRDNIFIRNG